MSQIIFTQLTFRDTFL